MGISITDRQAYSEVDEFLELLPDYERNKIPERLRDFFKNEKDIYYMKKIDPNISIKEQALKEETLAIIAFLTLKYWCKDEEEKKMLMEIYEKNDVKYQKIFENINNGKN